ncbi:MAG: hypothetical protein AAGB34_05435 [Planctomycetota bacterium]
MRQHQTTILSTALAVAGAAPAFATINAAGDVNPSPPVAGQGVVVGDTGIGTLTIDAGSVFSTGTTNNDQSVTIGAQSTGDGTLLVDGIGTSLETRFLRVGVLGSASFTASGGAFISVTNDFSIRGNNTATVTGTGTIFEAGDSIFLNGSTGATLNVQDNATFRIVPPTDDRRFFIGSNPGEKGIVNVTSGATLEFLSDGTDPFRTFIGFQDGATGELNISSGGQVTLGRTDVGTESLTANGVINVDGAGSTLNIVTTVTGDGNGEGDIRLGSNGGGTAVLNVTNGATVNVEDDIFVALGDDSNAAFNALGGTINIGDGLFVGYNSTGPLTVGATALITANRFVVTNTSQNPNITPGHAAVTFNLSEDTAGNPLNGLIDTTDFSFRDGTSELILDLDSAATFDIGDVFVLVDYDTLGANSFGAPDQFFDNVGDDQVISFDGVSFLIDYDDANFGGTALTATVIPTPAAAMLLLGVGVVGGRRRRTQI